MSEDVRMDYARKVVEAQKKKTSIFDVLKNSFGGTNTKAKKDAQDALEEEDARLRGEK